MPHKKIRFFSAIQLLFLFLLAFAILRAPGRACALAALALELWFEKMIPSLFPFMILSGLIVRLDFSRLISLPIYPLLGRIYRINKTMCTTMFAGFLFGFPLGAKTVAEQYGFGQLSKPQAQYLLSFCNNIGPVYLLSFVLPLLGLSPDTGTLSLRHAVIIVFFGLPLLYGLILRHTAYRHISFSQKHPDLPSRLSSARAYPNTDSPKSDSSPASADKKTPGHFPLRAASADASDRGERGKFLSALDASVTSACAAITRLGGYMIFFIVCNLLTEQAAALAGTPAARVFAAKLVACAAPLLEITSGLSLARGILPPALLMTMVTFGGLSCFAQTYTCIRDTNLSFGNYCLHKLLQSAIAFCLYALLFSVFSGRMPALS